MIKNILYIAGILFILVCLYMAHELGSNSGWVKGKAEGFKECSDIWANMPPMTIPGVPETVWVKKEFTGSGKVKPKPVDTLIICPTIEIDSTIIGDKSEIIRVHSEDVAKNGVNIYWSFPYEEPQISQVDTLKLPYPVPVEIPVPEKKWGIGITLSGGYGFYKAQPDIHIGIGLYYRIW